MRKVLLFYLFIIVALSAKSQRFFYINPENKGSAYFLVNLKNASQYISKTPVGSDCTIKTETIITPYKTIIKITMQDSTTFKTIFENAEEYSYNTIKLDAGKLQDFFFKIFAEKYTEKIVLYAKRNNFNYYLTLLKDKKDKT